MDCDRGGRLSVALVVLVLTGVPAALADPTPVEGRAKATVEQSARTGGHAARDGALTFGRSARDFFTKGPAAAKRTWKANAARTKATAHSDARGVKAAAHGE